ncbi:MAG: ATP12 chaperone family protein [Micavibrio sp.]|nr:ATP12 chaperone family protein [Micavibrio sp.]|tara:strand:- start:1134 stop:1838 length:705 start_codon:yes stop_codon:yes gene_type:complete
MKRFYKAVSINAEDNGFAIHLDGKPIRTPNKNIFLAPNEALALLAKAEWDAQGDKINHDTMPVTQLLNTCQDRIHADRSVLEPEVLKYINTDLLCYRADAPAELVARQDKIWQKPLDWFEKQYGLKFETTCGLGALKQPAAIHEAITGEIKAMDDQRFTIVQMVTPACGSVVLALAFVQGAATADELMACAFLEEDYKFDLYNEDIHGGDPLTEKKKANLRRDLDAAQAYLQAL